MGQHRIVFLNLFVYEETFTNFMSVLLPEPGAQTVMSTKRTNTHLCERTRVSNGCKVGSDHVGRWVSAGNAAVELGQVVNYALGSRTSSRCYRVELCSWLIDAYASWIIRMWVYAGHSSISG